MREWKSVEMRRNTLNNALWKRGVKLCAYSRNSQELADLGPEKRAESHLSAYDSPGIATYVFLGMIPIDCCCTREKASTEGGLKVTSGESDFIMLLFWPALGLL